MTYPGIVHYLYNEVECYFFCNYKVNFSERMQNQHLFKIIYINVWYVNNVNTESKKWRCFTKCQEFLENGDKPTLKQFSLQVRLGFFQSGIEKGYVVFDAHGSTKTSWFSSDRILYSSWTDLSRDTTYAYSSVTG